jgi:hypothetical protein
MFYPGFEKVWSGFPSHPCERDCSSESLQPTEQYMVCTAHYHVINYGYTNPTSNPPVLEPTVRGVGPLPGVSRRTVDSTWRAQVNFTSHITFACAAR